ANTSFSSAQFDKAFFNKISNTLNNPTTNEGAKFNGAFVATNSIFSDSNLAGSTFMGNLSGSQLVSVNLQNSILTGTNFSNCVMSLITFSGNGGDAVTQANNCNFENAVLTQALFDKANLQGSSFKNANLTNAKLDEVLGIIGIDLSGTNLTAANLTGLDLSSNPPAKHGTGGNVVITSDTNFTKAQMNHVDLSNQKLDGVNFLAASMQFAKCTTCSFEKSILVGADLTSATFSANTSFLEANLSNVVLANCDLSGANFSADTQGTNAAILTNAYMPNAVLTDAKLYAVNMSGCSWYGPASKANKAQMEQVNLSNANLATLDLSQAVMIGANLTFANMVNSNLTGVDLTPTQDNRSTSLAFASLQGTNFTQAQLTNADLTNAAVSLDIQSSSGFMKGNLAFTVKGSDTVTITSITSDLSRLIIDDYLISAFAENGVTIDAKNGISIVTAGVSWLIRDSDGKQFILVFDTNKILVY
ncbi:MAG: pentapeptide repeat-containing protein, partial [Bacteroidota bacterium]